MLTAPPMTTTSLTRRKVSGSSADARARFVRGPTATSVTVSGSFSRSARRISLCAGNLDRMNEWSPGWAPVRTGLIPSVSTVGSKRCSQVWLGVRCGCCSRYQIVFFEGLKDRREHTLAWMPPRPSVPSAGYVSEPSSLRSLTFNHGGPKNIRK